MKDILPRALLCALALASAASAHPIDVAYFEVRLEGARARAQLDLSEDVAQKLAPIERDALFRATIASGLVEADGKPCKLTPADLARADGRVRLTGFADCAAPIRALKWPLPFIDNVSLDYRVLARALAGGEERDEVLEPGQSTLRVEGPPERGFFGFVLLGIHHIGAAPSEWHDKSGWHLPGGIDHILFLLALILAGGGLLRTLGTVTGFTVGHSITLALATLDVVRVPGRIAESAIALSIVYVAVEDLVVKEPKHRWRIATAFGLLHGFGFASALTELHLSRAGLASALFGFNAGVEVGQAVIVALLAPAVLALRKQKWFAEYGSRACAAAIAAAGTFWFVQRAFY